MNTLLTSLRSVNHVSPAWPTPRARRPAQWFPNLPGRIRLENQQSTGVIFPRRFTFLASLPSSSVCRKPSEFQRRDKFAGYC